MPVATAYISVSGMHCAACATTAARVLRQQLGVSGADISFASEQGRLRYDPARTDAATILKSLDRLGFAARIVGDSGADPQRSFLDNTALQLITAVAFGMQVMGLSLAHLYPAYSAGTFDAPDIRSVQYLAWFLTTPVLFYGGSSFLLGAVRAARARTATMDTLVSLGTLSAYFYSVFFTLNGGGPVYFDSVAMITVFVMIGRYLEKLGGDQARKEIRSLLQLQPDNAWIREGDAWHEVRAASLAPGDTVLVKPGQRVPADLRILDGRAAMDEALLTGESLPVTKGRDDMIFAGTLVTDGALVCEAIRVSSDTRLAQITDIVEQALAAKPPVQRLADRVSAWFALVVIVAAILTFGIWWGLGHPASDGLLAAVAVLVVACPCALGLATPFAISISTGRAAHRGVLVRNPVALETAALVRRVVFDKTGTLTSGQFDVAEVAVASGTGLTEEELLCLAAAVEQYSEHPVAKAIVAGCPSGHLPAASDIRAVPGMGISGSVAGARKRRVSVGSIAFVEANASEELGPRAQACEANRQTVVWIGLDHALAGFVALHDAPRPSARQMLAEVQDMGLKVAMLSGDSARTVRIIAADIGLPDAEGEYTPDGKANRIRKWQALGESVAMVGDGINDAPALAQADLSVAMASGVDVAAEASDIVLSHTDLTLVPWFLRLFRKTRRIIRQNLVWAFAYNVVMVPLAATGIVSPMIAAGTMAASSLLVVGNSLRLRS